MEPTSTPTSRLADRSFDLVVVGGGILGACAAWEAALRGLSVALLERNDFGQATSANSLKIVHGGLRYLQHMDLRRFRESVQERSLWLRKAPHLVAPLPVLFPAGDSALHSRPVLRAGLLVNDLLSAGRNRGLDPTRQIPPGRLVSRSELIRRVPELAHENIPGGVLFHDAIFRFPERLVLEVVQAAVELGAMAANYVEFTGVSSGHGRVTSVRARDTLTGEEVEIRTRAVLNTAGAGSEAVAARLSNGAARVAPAWSSAVNLVVEGRGHDAAFTLPARSTPGVPAPRQLFVVPWRGQTMIGTGHYPLVGELPTPGDSLELERVKRDAAERFLAEVNRSWPGTESFTMDQVALIHWGLLPAQEGRPGDPVELLRKERVIDHSPHGTAGAFTLLGVKFTTGRRAAQEAVDRVCGWLERGGPAGASRQAALPSAASESIQRLKDRLGRKYPGVVGDEESQNLVATYGSRAESVLQLAASDTSLAERVVPGLPVIRAQLLHGVRHEMVRRPEDLVWRRTELGLLGGEGQEPLEAAREIMRAEVGR